MSVTRVQLVGNVSTGASFVGVVTATSFSGNVTATSLVVSSGSTFTNGPILVGTGTSTGTTSQVLQVNGGAYFAGVGVATGSIGVGITNPQGTIDIRTSPQWSSFNYGANLVIGGTRNNAFGILDSTNSNPWAIGNNAGSLIFAQMPALGNTTSGVSEAARITTNQNLVIGSITETGTASQPLQVTGGAYVSGNLGIGTTTPTSKLHVVGDARITGAMTAVDFNSTSDISLKENIHTVGNALEITEQLRGVSFDWKETGRSSYGVIAQELEEVLPELVGDGTVKSVNYNGIIGVLIEAIKELKKEIEDLKNTK